MLDDSPRFSSDPSGCERCHSVRLCNLTSVDFFQLALALAPDTMTVDVIAAGVLQRCAVAQVCDREQESVQHRGLVEAAQVPTGVPATEPDQRDAPAARTDGVEYVSIDDAGA